MAFNSYHRRGSRSAAHATLANQNFDEVEELLSRNVNALDIHILNAPLQHEQDAVSEDSRLFTNEVKSEEFAILSTSSERDANRELELVGDLLGAAAFEKPELEGAAELAVSKSQRIDDWCLQNGLRNQTFQAPANRKIQDIIEAWGVVDDSPPTRMLRPFRQSEPSHKHPENYTAHLLDLMSPPQRLRLRKFVEQMMPLLKRQLTTRFQAYRFKSVPSAFINRDLQLHCSLQGELLLEPQSANDLVGSMNSDHNESSRCSSPSSISKASENVRSWHSWNMVSRSDADHIPSY
ncbi:Atg36p [Lachancea thermotolerans CBS 6340]|uniref:KLTH0F04114p n=1 Tax=Lachancea thermotolerans (strain ATCC 56472 / CBS 6340 / NRRL Y-8284) TaxID=559295 RepID=C5DKE9_LACTC|nr:KLTH0F04114p [Lachancea thermotolerans CBS 6340]CAR23950.1 KLTH0F04114p [Lachancea thermotolerans CBS 6340]